MSDKRQRQAAKRAARKQKAARPVVRQATMGRVVPSELLPIIAQVTHEAVEELGVPHMRCADYTVIGAMVIRELTGVRCVPQCGTLGIVVGHDEQGAFMCGLDAEKGGMESLEFHAWIAAMGEPTALLDLSSRNYPALCNHIAQKTGDDRLRWPADRDVPDFIWSPERKDLPDWLQLNVVERETRFFWEKVQDGEFPHAERARAAVARARELMKGIGQ